MDGRRTHLSNRRAQPRRAVGQPRGPNLLEVIAALRDAEHALAAYLEDSGAAISPEDHALFLRQLQQVRQMQVLTCKTAVLRSTPCGEPGAGGGSKAAFA